MQLLPPGKVAVVTGIGPGLGREIALGLAELGTKLAIGARSAETLESVAAEIRAAGGEVLAQRTDLTDRASCQSLVAAAKQFGGVDILVQNGHDPGDWSSVEDADPEHWRKVMETNLFGALHLYQACLPSMMENRGGNIVTLGGDNALSGAVGKASSSAAKNGLVGLTRALAKELAEYGIRVNCVSPGNMNTTRPAYRPPKDSPKGKIPLGRWGEPDEIAAAVRFLCGPGGGFITGQTLHINGGQYVFA